MNYIEMLANSKSVPPQAVNQASAKSVRRPMQLRPLFFLIYKLKLTSFDFILSWQIRP
jgi:hypothetical protein